MTRLAPALAALAVLALAACGGGGGERTVVVTETVVETKTVTVPPAEMISLRVYLLRDGRVAAAARRVPRTPAVAAAALRALVAGPSGFEREAGLATELPEGAELSGLAVSGGIATLSVPAGLSRAALAQVVYTLTQFPSVRAVELDGTRRARADFEDVTPAILVESPAPGETVASPLRARGTANTFEATFQLTVTDPEGLIVAEETVTATSGSGTRGTFDVSVPFVNESGRAGQGAVIVFELSAEDGSQINLVEIPVRMRR